MENETGHSLHDGMKIVSRTEETLNAPVKQYVTSMYQEFKKCFESRNLSKIEKILKNIANVDPASNILNLIWGALALCRGQAIESYTYLFKYAQNSTSVDLWAMSVMAMWNFLAGEETLALEQFGKVMEGQFSTRFLLLVLVFSAKIKKRTRFLERSLDYFERLTAVPEGFKLSLLIRLEIIHIQILKGNYTEALEEIDTYNGISTNCFVKRLRVYLHYKLGEYKEILRYKKEEHIDPYIAYVIARIGLECTAYQNQIDIPYFLDEAIKYAKDNEYIYNTYGNYYYSIRRYSDAAEQYNNALSLDPKFTPAITNLTLFVKANSKSNQPIYVTKNNRNSDLVLSDVDPDVETMGFLDTWRMVGYPTFKIDWIFVSKSPSLKYYF